MAKVFLSHSSKDKEFVRWLAGMLTDLGHDVWLDEWEIKIGDCIVSGIEKGIENSDYVAVVLSQNSVQSEWVDREWKAKYWEEIQSKKIKVLPLKLENCKIPVLLTTKKYADFSQKRMVGFIDLVNAIGPLIQKQNTHLNVSDIDLEVSNLIRKIQSRSFTLSECIAESLLIAKQVKSKKLEYFARGELKGWSDVNEVDNDKGDLTYRTIYAYATLSTINVNYWEFSGNPDRAITYMANDPENFKPFRMLIPYPISYFEEKSIPVNSILSGKMPFKSFVREAENSDALVNLYFPGTAYQDLVEQVRGQLVKLLLEILPQVTVD